MDHLRAIQVFRAIADTGSLSAAARKTGQPLTTVSRQLAALEAHVGATLIARTTRRMAFTDDGKAYLETCRQVLDELELAESRISGRRKELKGELAITAPVVFGRLHVLPIAGAFIRRHPAITARLVLADTIVDLTQTGIDIAVRVGQLPDSTLLASRTGSLRWLTCAAPGYLKIHGTPATPEDLTGHQCIVFSSAAGNARWVFNSRAHGRRSQRIHARLSVNAAEAAIDAAASGLGVTRVLSYQAEAALKTRALRVILEPFDDTLVPVHLVHRSGRLAKPAVSRFLDFAARELRARLQGLPGP